MIISYLCFTSGQYVSMVTKKTVSHNPTLSELENMQLNYWNYPLTEIEHILENNIDVILVQFPKGNGTYEYRLCEVKKEDLRQKENNSLSSIDNRRLVHHLLASGCLGEYISSVHQVEDLESDKLYLCTHPCETDSEEVKAVDKKISLLENKLKDMRKGWNPSDYSLNEEHKLIENWIRTHVL